MKVLIAYDGSDCADAALEDLAYAGLPEIADAIVLAVAEIIAQLPEVAALTANPGYDFPDDARVEALNERQLAEAQALAVRAADRLRALFPQWRLATESEVDAAESALVRKAADWQPDLMVVGSHGRSGVRRFFLGSVSHYVLNHTRCSVRIGRRHPRAPDRPIRLLVGVDGSPDATTALQSLAARRWPMGTQVHVVGVVDSRSWLPVANADVSGVMPALGFEEELRRQVSQTVDHSVRTLTNFGLLADPHVCAGDPAQVLVAEAEQWDADGIVVARGLNALERVVIGSVSTTVAMRAHCSVEVVRRQA